MDVGAGDKAETTLDDVLIKFNIFGRYYVKCLIIIGLSLASSSVLSNGYVFIAVEVEYRCADERFGNNDSCASLSNSSDVCAEWVYEDPHSFVAEFQLACQEWKRTLVGSAHNFGMMIGLMIVGPLSDRIGRQKTIAIFGTLTAITGLAKSFSNYYWIYIILEFTEAAFLSHFSPVFLLSVELVAHEKRLIFVMLTEFGYAMGFLILPLAAWSVPYWKHLCLVLYTPLFLYILYLFLMDESPRWLLSKGRKDEAVAILQKMAKSHKMEVDTKYLTHNDNEIENVKYIQVLNETFKSTVLLKRFLICVTWWLACTFVNYGLQINSVSLQGNKYVNFSYLGVVETLGNIILTYFITRFRRKMPLVWVFFLGAMLCSCQVFTPKDLPGLSVFLYMSGKLMASIFFGITYVYTSEIFPTYTRNSMHALCSSLGRIGSILAPQTPLLVRYWQGLPSLTCGIVSLIAGLVTLLAPDTADQALPDTVFQAEALGEDQSKPKIENHEDKF